MKRFQEDAEIPVFLIASKKADSDSTSRLPATSTCSIRGGTPRWEAQAIDHAHIGQSRNVMAYRLVQEDCRGLGAHNRTNFFLTDSVNPL